MALDLLQAPAGNVGKELFALDQQLGEPRNLTTLAALLKHCGKAKVLSDGRQVHAHISRCRYDDNTFLGNCLVEMYGNCESVEDAQAVFDSLPNLNLYSWNILINAYNKNGFSKEALDLFYQMQFDGFKPDPYTFVCGAIACASLKDLEAGQEIHAAIIENGYAGEVILGNTLIGMYSKCGSLHDARRVFDQMPQLTLASWNVMIVACTHNGYGKEALNILQQMRLDGCKPDIITFVCALEACVCLESLTEGQKIHSAIADSEYGKDLIVGNALVSMYGKCGSLSDAKNVFVHMPEHDVYSWNALIVACTYNGDNEEGLSLVHQMQSDLIKPNLVTFVCWLDACANLAGLEKGQEMHAAIINSGYDREIVVGNALVNMYGKCGCVYAAKGIFEGMPEQNVVSWSTMISVCAQNGFAKEALHFFNQMQLGGIEPNHVTFVCVLDACATLASLEEGQKVHVAILDSNYMGELLIGNALVSMYGKCGNLNAVQSTFSKMPQRDVVTWNAMITAFTQNGHCKEALDFYRAMQLDNVKPDKITLICALDACARLASLGEGREVHTFIVDYGCEREVMVGNALINLYSKCGSLHDVRTVFAQMFHHNVVSFNAIITACAQNGHGREALYHFYHMQLSGLQPDDVTFISALDACATLSILAEGQEIHAAIVNSRYRQDVAVGTALINMYSRCGSLCNARSVFDGMPHQDVVSWSSMISATAQHGLGKEALELYHQMQHEGLKPNHVTFICALDACASLTAIDAGKAIHAAIVNCGYEGDVIVDTALMNMYGKCGVLHYAKNMFDRMVHRNIICWNAMVAACAQNGHVEATLDLFHQMQIDDIKPDHITFHSILTACNHTGRVNEGKHYFSSMSQEHGIVHTVEHYLCMVDLLCRAGYLDDAEKLIMTMPFENRALVWSCLLAACRIHDDLERGVRAATQVLKLDTGSSAPYMLLSNICAAAGKLDGSEELTALKTASMHAFPVR